MKSSNYLLLALALSSLLVLASFQFVAAKCGYDDKLNEYKNQNPEEYTSMKNLLDNPSEDIRQHVHRQLRASSASVITVVFHFLWNPKYTADPSLKVGFQDRINQELIFANNWFNQLNPYYKDRDPYFASAVQDTPAPIAFRLATADANGNAFPGYTQRDVTFADCSNAPGSTSYYSTANGGTDPYDQTKFYNVWVCDLTGGVVGFATFPTDPPQITDGAVFAHNQLAATDSAGSTFVHEFLHYLAIDHTFQGGCTPPGDSISDTPPTSGDAINQFNSLCSGIPAGTTATNYQSCGGVAQVENLMDYNQEPCIRYMTKGQVQKALTTLAQSPRASLVAYSGSQPAAPPPPPPPASPVPPQPSPSQGAVAPSPNPAAPSPSSAPVCTPSCAGKNCGDNGCGGSCGVCLASETCSTAGQCAPTTPPTNGVCTTPDVLSAGVNNNLLNNKPFAANNLVSNCGAGVSNISAPLWYKVTGSNNVISVDTCRSRTTVPTRISVFTNCPADASTGCVAGNNNGCGASSKVSFCARSGQDYYVAIGSVSTAGQLDAYFNVSSASCNTPPPPPPSCVPNCTANSCADNGCGGVCVCASGLTCLSNGVCANPGNTPTNTACGSATSLTPSSSPGVSTLFTTDGIPQTNTPNDCLKFPRASGAYFSLVGTGTVVTATTCTPQTEIDDTTLSVLSGSCPSPTCVAFNDDDSNCALNGYLSTVTFCAASGTTYYLDARGYSSTGIIDLNVQTGAPCTPLPTATCPSASDITKKTVVVDTTYALSTPNLTPCTQSSLEGSELINPTWHSFLANTNNYWNVSTCHNATQLDTLVRVYKGSCPSLTCVASGDDDPSCSSGLAGPLATTVPVCASSGNTYYVAAYGYNQQLGPIEIGAFDTGSSCCQPANPCPSNAQCGQDDCGNQCSLSSCSVDQTCQNFLCTNPSVSPASTLSNSVPAASNSPAQASNSPAQASNSPAAVSPNVQPSPASGFNVCIPCDACRTHKFKKACRNLSGQSVVTSTSLCCDSLPTRFRNGPFSVTVRVRRTCVNTPRRQITLRSFCAALGGSISCSLRSDGYYDWKCSR